MADTTAIRVSKETWRRLSALKNDPGESFDDIVGELLDERGEGEPTAEARNGGEA